MTLGNRSAQTMPRGTDKLGTLTRHGGPTPQSPITDLEPTFSSDNGHARRENTDGGKEKKQYINTSIKKYRFKKEEKARGEAKNSKQIKRGDMVRSVPHTETDYVMIRPSLRNISQQIGQIHRI